MEQKFLAKLRAEHELCMAYENPKAQIEARKAVPLDKLKKAAKEKFEKLKAAESQDSTKIVEEVEDDIFVIELLGWFKNEFFKWFDGYECETCTVKTPDGATKKSKT